jgi:predicted cupin superfamily sugar epimerase
MMASLLSAREVRERLDLRPHPEGGSFREVYRETASGGGRGALSSILYLLAAGEVSAWHRIRDAAEIWLFHAGAPLELSLAPADGSPATTVMGTDLATGEQPQIAIPAGVWQSARSRGAWSLVGCVVAPAFEYAGFELAPPQFSPW